MKPVTMYQSADGAVWATETEAFKRDTLVLECREVEKIIGPYSEQPGGTYRQHAPATAAAFHNAVVGLARRYTAWFDGWAKVPNDADVYAGSIFGRIVDDSGLKPLNKLWYRIHCLDTLGREWDQPFFAIKAREEATQQVPA